MNKMKCAVLTVAMFGCLSLCAKDLKVLVVKTTPEMHCNNCENKIKSNVRFVSGVKKIDTNLENKTVSVTYDADKTNADKITEAFKKIKYETTIVSDKKVEKKDHKLDGKSGASEQTNKKK